jgi:hypothetical protein
LESVVHRATAKDPDDRYLAAGDFAVDLQNVLNGKRVSASPYNYKYDYREIVSERPASVMAASVFVILINFHYLFLFLFLSSQAGSFYFQVLRPREFDGNVIKFLY